MARLLAPTLALLAATPSLAHVIGEKRDTYNYYKMWDFRSLASYAGVPAVQTSVSGAANAGVTSSYFSSDAWTSDWSIQTWNSASGPVQMQNSKSNVYIEATSDGSTTAATYLTLRTNRQNGFQSVAEFDSVSSNFEYLSMYMYARTTGAAGACTSMFTYQSDTQESDLEILTSGPQTKIQYTNQPDTTSNTTIPNGGKWTDWASHRLDWSAGKTTWYINNVQVAQFTTDVPTTPSTLIFNAWGNGNEWTGPMAVGASAYLQIQYIELYHNNPELTS